MPNFLYADDGSLRITVVNGTTLTGLNAPDGSMYVVEGNPAIHRGLYHPCGAMLVKVNADSTSSSIPAYSPEGFRNISLAPFGTTITGAMRCTIVSGAFANTTIVILHAICGRRRIKSIKILRLHVRSTSQSLSGINLVWGNHTLNHPAQFMRMVDH
jgi:hypothetical protein